MQRNAAGLPEQHSRQGRLRADELSDARPVLQPAIGFSRSGSIALELRWGEMNSPAPDPNNPQPTPANPNPEPARPATPSEAPQPNEAPELPPPSPDPVPSPEKEPVQIPPGTPAEIPVEPGYPFPTDQRQDDG